MREPFELGAGGSRATLFGARTGNCLRVAVALEEAEIAYDTRKVDLAGGEQRGRAFGALNPAGKVPVLVVADGPSPFVLTQSNAILLHLDEARPGRLLPTDSPSRSLALERLFFFLMDVVAPSHAAFRVRAVADRAAITTLEQASVDMLAFSERFLESGPFMAGDRFTLADIVAATITTKCHDALDWDRLPRLARWFETVSSRPAVQRGMNAFDP